MKSHTSYKISTFYSQNSNGVSIERVFLTQISNENLTSNINLKEHYSSTNFETLFSGIFSLLSTIEFITRIVQIFVLRLKDNFCTLNFLLFHNKVFVPGLHAV